MRPNKRILVKVGDADFKFFLFFFFFFFGGGGAHGKYFHGLTQSGPYYEPLWPKIGIVSHLLMEFHLRHAVIMRYCGAV